MDCTDRPQTRASVHGYNSKFAHKICAAISKSRLWYIYFKSMIVFKVISCGTAHHCRSPRSSSRSGALLEETRHAKPLGTLANDEYPSIWSERCHQWLRGTHIMEVPSYTPAYEEDGGGTTIGPSAARIYYQSKAKAKRAFSNTLKLNEWTLNWLKFTSLGNLRQCTSVYWL